MWFKKKKNNKESRTLIESACDRIEKEGKYTEDNIKNLEEALLNSNIKSFSDADFKYFVNFINEKEFDKRIQDMIGRFVDSLSDKGIESPCLSGCSSDSCAFHDMEFN